MTQDRRTFNALAALLPAGTLGLSIGLASAGAKASTTAGPETKQEPGAIHERLQAIRKTVSTIVNEEPAKDADGRDLPFLKVDPEQKLAWWGNGWHNGGWNNWGNGWHNGGWGNILPVVPFANGGWHNWHNGWHNGWHNW